MKEKLKGKEKRHFCQWNAFADSLMLSAFPSPIIKLVSVSFRLE